MIENNELKHHHGWDFDRRISLGNILTAIAIAVPFFLYISKMDERIGLLEQRVEIEVRQRKDSDATLEKRFEIERQEARQERRAISTQISTQFNSLNNKFDKILHNK